MAECREIPTRICPLPYGGPCGDRPCARFEAEDEDVWREHWRIVDRDLTPDLLERARAIAREEIATHDRREGR